MRHTGQSLNTNRIPGVLAITSISRKVGLTSVLTITMSVYGRNLTSLVEILILLMFTWVERTGIELFLFPTEPQGKPRKMRFSTCVLMSVTVQTRRQC